MDITPLIFKHKYFLVPLQLLQWVLLKEIISCEICNKAQDSLPFILFPTYITMFMSFLYITATESVWQSGYKKILWRQPTYHLLWSESLYSCAICFIIVHFKPYIQAKGVAWQYKSHKTDQEQKHLHVLSKINL